MANSVATRQSKRQKDQQAQPTNDAECMSAVTYFRTDQDTVVLWLGTMLNAPPVESVNVTWRNCGFATYLLCLLIKQHTGILQDMSKSLLSIQATPTHSKDACLFYQCLGFSCYKMKDNGLSLTSPSFQSEVIKKPKLWIHSSSSPMSLFQLHQG